MTTLAAVADLESPTHREQWLTGADPTAASEPALSCPACGSAAYVEWRDMFAGTSGPVVHVKLRCAQGRHWFLMPEDEQ